MIKTKKYIKELQENFIRINNKQEILKFWGEYIDNHVFTPQDVWEQTRKIISKYAKTEKIEKS